MTDLTPWAQLSQVRCDTPAATAPVAQSSTDPRANLHDREDARTGFPRERETGIGVVDYGRSIR